MKAFKALLILTLAAASVIPIFSQDIETELTAAYFDTLFNKYIELETDILQNYEDGSLISYKLGIIENLRKEAVDEGRADIISRLDMLSFVVRTGIEDQTVIETSGAVLAQIAEAEKEARSRAAIQKAMSTGAWVSIGSSIVSGSVFAAAALISSDFYNKYTRTEYADQAAFYLFWWQFLEKVSAVSAVTTIITGTAAGIFAAIQ